MTFDSAIHRSTLIRILTDIYTNLLIGPHLGFKGGTAVYLFYDLSRFSVDLDFDLLSEERGEIIFDKIQEILSGYGEVKDAQKKRYSYFFLLSYANKMTGAYNIKVEINRRLFRSEYEIKQYLGIPMKVMVTKDIFAHKLVAMLERIGKANRDVYDVWFFLSKNWPINESIIEKRTGLSFNLFLQKCISTLEQMSNRGILSGLGELLDLKQKNWVKEKLLNDTIFLLKIRLEQTVKSSD
jgi:predicted nucleotidyltransferase component of viral defense system